MNHFDPSSFHQLNYPLVPVPEKHVPSAEPHIRSSFSPRKLSIFYPKDFLKGDSDLTVAYGIFL